MNRKKNILVTGVGGRSVGSGILHSLTRSHSISKNLWNVVAADADPFSWGLYKTGSRVILPHASASDFQEKILKVIDDYKIDAVIPGTEIEVEKISGFREKIPVPVLINKKELIPLMMDKAVMQKKMEELRLPFIPVYPFKNWETAVKDFGFPLIAKPSIGTGASRGLAILLNEKEILKYIDNSLPESAAIIQPYIGNPEEEYTVGILSDKDGNLIDSIVMKRKLIGLSLLDSRKYKNNTISISTGYSQGFFIRDKPVQDFCERVSAKIGSCGPLNIQLRKDREEIFVFEIHPRFSGTTTMRSDVGFNEPDLLLRNYLFGEKSGRVKYQTDVAVIRAFEHVVVPLSEMPEIKI